MKSVACPLLYLPLCLLLCLAALAAGCGSGPSTETPEELGRLVARMLRDGDQKGFMEQAFLSDRDLDCLDQHEDQEIKADVADLRDGGMLKMRMGGNRDWVRTIKDGKAEGVDWSGVEFHAVRPELEEYKGITHGDIYLVLKQEDRLWEVRIDDCVQCGGRWFTMDGLRFEGPAD